MIPVGTTGATRRGEAMTTTSEKVTIVNPDPGCYVEGWWGQYAPVHAIEQAESFGYVIDPELQTALDCYAGPYPQEPAPCDYTGPYTCSCTDIVVEASDDATEWLNEHTMGPRWYSWHWADGELFYGIDTGDGDTYHLEEIAKDLQDEYDKAQHDAGMARIMRRNYMQDLRDAGLDTTDIAQIIGISRQRVEQILAHRTPDLCHDCGQPLADHIVNAGPNATPTPRGECHTSLID